jgi:hypothetical protein
MAGALNNETAAIASGKDKQLRIETPVKPVRYRTTKRAHAKGRAGMNRRALDANRQTI